MKIIITEQQNEKLNRKIRFVVEKLGLEQSLEMFGNEIIKQSYINNPELFLNQFNNLKPIKTNNAICYINDDNKLLIYYYFEDIEKNNGYYFINYDKIWCFFNDILGYIDTQTEDILKKWLSTMYNLYKLTPNYFVGDFNIDQLF